MKKECESYVPVGALILAERGFVPIEEVRLGEKVLTHMGRWKPVISIQERDIEVATVKGNHFGFKCSVDSYVLTAKTKRVRQKRAVNLLESPPKRPIIDKKWMHVDKAIDRYWGVPRLFEELDIPMPLPSIAGHRDRLSPELFYTIWRNSPGACHELEWAENNGLHVLE